MSTIIKASFAGVCACLVTVSLLRADTITVTNIPTTTTDFGYLSAASNSDPLLIDLNGPGETINGAVFTGSGSTGAGSDGVSYALTGPALSAYPNYDAGAADPNVETLLSNFFYGGNNRDELLTINGLTPGDSATLTVLGAAFGAGATSGREEAITGSGGAMLADYEENNGMFSTLAYTTIVPPSGTISIASAATDTGGDTLHYYGFTVSQTAVVPEPASVVLFVLGAVGVCIFASRRRIA